MSLYDPALRYFIAVYDTGSINAAARTLYVAGSAISRQIGKLEREVGSALFDRDAHGLRPTPAGEAFAGYARRSIDEANRLVDHIQQRDAGGANIVVASSPGTARVFMPAAMAHFQVRHPGIRFTLLVQQSGPATESVRQGTADLAVTFSLGIEPNITVLSSQAAPIQALMRKDHPLAHRESLTVHQLCKYPLALASTNHTNRRLFDICCASERIVVDPVLICDDPSALATYVQSTDAITLLGQISQRHDLDAAGMASIPVANKEMNRRTLQVQTHPSRDLPAVTRQFAESLVEGLTHIEL